MYMQSHTQLEGFGQNAAVLITETTHLSIRVYTQRTVNMQISVTAN